MSNIELSRQKLRDLQKMLYDEVIDKKGIFNITLEIENLLNKSTIEFNNLKKINSK